MKNPCTSNDTLKRASKKTTFQWKKMYISYPQGMFKLIMNKRKPKKFLRLEQVPHERRYTNCKQDSLLNHIHYQINAN